MKKFIFQILIISAFVFTANYAIAEDDYIVENSEEQVSEAPVEQNNANNAYLLKVQWDTLSTLDNNNVDYKITKDGKVGYLNNQDEYTFLTDYDDIFPLGEYLKVKSKKLFGLIDKSGRVILTPVFDKIDLMVNNEGREYIVTKKDGKYRLFYNTGNIVPESELYTVTTDTSFLLAKDIRPLFKRAYTNTSDRYQEVSNNAETYEIQEIPIPRNIGSHPTDVDITKVVESNENFEENNNETLLEIGNLQYYLTRDNDRVGISSSNGKEILSPMFNEITFNTPCKHYKNPILIANRDGVNSIYDLSGNLLAEQTYQKINVYKFGKVFSYIPEKGVYMNSKKIGDLTQNEDGYVFEKTAFCPYPLHKITELLISLVNNL